MPVAACVLLAIALGIVAYRSGLNRGEYSAKLRALPAKPSASLLEQISDFGLERAQLLAKFAEDDKALKRLTSEVAEEAVGKEGFESSNNTATSKELNGGHSGIKESGDSSRRDNELAAAQTNLQTLQAKTDALSQQRADESRRALALEGKVQKLTEAVRSRDQTL